MKLTLAMLALAFSLALAAEEGSWGGMLADAVCKQQTPQAACGVDASTEMFGLVLPDGQFLPFDAGGNQKASAELKGVTEKSNPQVTVEGDTDGRSIAVASLSFL